jgi:hypothetical protein
MQYDREKVRENAGKSETEDLLDRVTVYRADMEPDALYVIEEELRQRGVTAADIDAHARQREAGGLFEDGGLTVRCSFCDRPAVARGWGWHRYRGRWLPESMKGRLPLFPRPFWYCAVHRSGAAAPTASR